MDDLKTYTVSVSDKIKTVGRVWFELQATSPTQAAKIAATRDLVPYAVDMGIEFERYVRVAGVEVIDLYKVCFKRRSQNTVSFASLELVQGV